MEKPPFQFTIRTLLWLTMVAGAFLCGILFEKERMKRTATKAQSFPIDFVHGVHERDLGKALDRLIQQFGQKTSTQGDK